VTDLTHRSPRRWLSLLVAALLTLTASASTLAASPSGSTGNAGRPIQSRNLVPYVSGDGATLIDPDPNVVDLNRQPWDHIRVAANGKRLTVYFWMGIQDCYGLGVVDVSRGGGQLTVQLWTGTQPKAVGKVCPELAQLYKTIVHLDRPIIQGGTV
jgi:hypothetical protein